MRLFILGGALAALLAGCAAALGVTLTASGFTAVHYAAQAPLALNGLHNPSSSRLSALSIDATCWEAGYPSLATRFHAGPVSIDAGATLSAVTLPYASGYPSFTGGAVSCSFQVANNGPPGEPSTVWLEVP